MAACLHGRPFLARETPRDLSDRFYDCSWLGDRVAANPARLSPKPRYPRAVDPILSNPAGGKSNPATCSCHRSSHQRQTAPARSDAAPWLPPPGCSRNGIRSDRVGSSHPRTGLISLISPVHLPDATHLAASAPTQILGQGGGELGLPVADGFIAEHDAAQSKHLRQGELVAQPPEHLERDDVAGGTAPGSARRRCAR